MSQVVGVFFPQGNVGTDTTVQVVVRVSRYHGSYRGRQLGEIVENPSSRLQMDADSPSQGIRREEQKNKESCQDN